MGDLNVNFQKLIEYLKKSDTFKLNDKGDELDPSHLAEFAYDKDEGCPEGTVFKNHFCGVDGEQAGFKDSIVEHVVPSEPGEYKFNFNLLDRESFIRELYVDGSNTLTDENLGRLYDIISNLDGL